MATKLEPLGKNFFAASPRTQSKEVLLNTGKLDARSKMHRHSWHGSIKEILPTGPSSASSSTSMSTAGPDISKDLSCHSRPTAASSQPVKLQGLSKPNQRISFADCEGGRSGMDNLGGENFFRVYYFCLVLRTFTRFAAILLNCKTFSAFLIWAKNWWQHLQKKIHCF